MAGADDPGDEISFVTPSPFNDEKLHNKKAEVLENQYFSLKNVREMRLELTQVLPH